MRVRVAPWTEFLCSKHFPCEEGTEIEADALKNDLQGCSKHFPCEEGTEMS